MRLSGAILMVTLWASGPLQAQHGPPPGPRGGEFRGGPPPPPPLGPMERSAHVGPPGRWWSDPRLAQLLLLTVEQQNAMDKVMEENRGRLMELNHTLRKEEADLRVLISADVVDEPKILSQVERVAGARAELEKANGRMLVGLRKVLDREQWRRLQADEFGHQFDRRH